MANDPTRPRDLRERLGVLSPWIALPGVGFVAWGISSANACGADDGPCLTGAAFWILLSLATFTIAMWAYPAGVAVELRRMGAQAKQQHAEDLRRVAVKQARPLEPPKRGPTMVRPGDDRKAGWKPLPGMRCPRCGSDTVWDGETSKWWCLREGRHV